MNPLLGWMILAFTSIAFAFKVGVGVGKAMMKMEAELSAMHRRATEELLETTRELIAEHKKVCPPATTAAQKLYGKPRY